MVIAVNPPAKKPSFVSRNLRLKIVHQMKLAHRVRTKTKLENFDMSDMASV